MMDLFNFTQKFIEKIEENFLDSEVKFYTESSSIEDQVIITISADNCSVQLRESIKFIERSCDNIIEIISHQMIIGLRYRIEKEKERRLFNK